MTRRRVSIVAESEGPLGVYAMLARHPDVPVQSVVLLSPIVDPGEARHAPSANPGANPGPGDALSALVRLAATLPPFGQSGGHRPIGSPGSRRRPLSATDRRSR